MKRLAAALAASVLLIMNAEAATVAVHDPSIVIAYKDAAGNTYPENDAGGSRTKLYYVFGTQMGAAYSKDMANWTSFTPAVTADGAVTTDYHAAFKTPAAWSRHTTSADVLGNLWAPDVIWNKSLGKWCMYISLNGDDWLSSIIMDTASKIEGPYGYAGTVVYSGMDKKSSGAGNADYQKVTGSSSVDSRYLDTGGNWTGTYGTSGIDPTVFYDESGRLWLVYGSWSGGIFLLKLSESTGLRNYDWNYGYSSGSAAWIGKRLRWDPYMGVHLAGGYYVSGEGSYIRYLTAPDSSTGYYYLFESMGFYSPEGGYSMRVFRSPTVDGIYTDETGDTAIFGSYVFNYGANLKYGFPVMQNYRWSWWSKGMTSLGHNSVLRDSGGKDYLVYHRKFDDGTVYHNVEVHPLVFNDRGWPMAAPFEQRTGESLRRDSVAMEEISGSYGIITHRAVDYAALGTNREDSLSLNADGSITGAYTGTWTYRYGSGHHFLTLATDSGTFNCVLLDQLLDGLGSRTLVFTGSNPSNERALWGYRRPVTWFARTRYVNDGSLTVGAADTTIAWNDYGGFLRDTVTGDFEAEYLFNNGTKGAENWHNWALAFRNGSGTWYLRADAWSVSAFSGSTVTSRTNWNGTIDYRTAFRGKNVRLKVRRQGTNMQVFAYVDSVLLETVTAVNCPTGTDTVYLGGEAVRLTVTKTSIGSLKSRQRVGTVADDGEYTAAFNTLFSDTTVLSGNSEIACRFINQHEPTSTDNWDNWILRQSSAGGAMLLRADSYALDAIGSVSFSQSWSWGEFLNLVSGATVDLDITRSGTTVNHAFTVTGRNGTVRTASAVQTGAPVTPLSYSFTVEQALVDLLRVEHITRIGTAGGKTTGATSGSITAVVPLIRVQDRRLVVSAERSGTLILHRIDGRAGLRFDYVAGTVRSAPLQPGIYVTAGKVFLIP